MEIQPDKQNLDRQHGESRTRRLVLEAWDRKMADGTFAGLDLPPPELLANPQKQVACS